MISEQKLEALSFPDAPKIVSATLPGPISAALLEEAPNYESMTRGGGRFPLVFDNAKGVTVQDPDGNLYVDMTAGVAVNSVGRVHPEVIAAIERQSKVLMHGSDISNTKRGELAKKISSIAPPGLRDSCMTYFTQSGSGAVESAVKFAKKITGKHQIIAFHGAYHGTWHAANSLTTGDQYRKGYGPFMAGVIHLPYQYCYRCPFGLKRSSCGTACAGYAEHVLNTPYTAADDVAAVIIEPFQGEGGYVPPDPEFLQAIKAACEKSGALLIADEVQAGAGRTGKMWSIEHTGVEPDMMTFGKGMGGDLPMAGLIMRRDLGMQLDDNSQPQTFAANALSAEVCMTNLNIIERDGLVQRAAELGKEAMKRLKDAAEELEIIGDIRGRGLMIGVELVINRETREPLSPDKTGAIVDAMLQRGVIMVPCGRYGNVLRLMPSLTIPRSYMNAGIDIMLNVLRNA